MGFQTMGSHGMGQQPHLQPLARQNSWFSLTLGEIENQCGEFSKPLGSMNLDELLKNVCTSEATQSSAMDIGSSSPASSLQRQASLALAKAFSGKTVDEVWRDIQQGQKGKNVEEIKAQDREPTLDEITLEDFLVKAGHFAEVSSGPLVGVDNAVTSQKVQPQISLSPSHSIDTLSDTPQPGRKRGSADAIEKTLERRLKRKIKNRESAARSRARKQAYHNELMAKVSCLEEENIKLKKEKVQPQISLSPSHSVDTLSDTPQPGRKRGSADAIEKTLERRLKRKIKNRESAARSRARKQAYHNELVAKVSCLEEENIKLKKEKELEKLLPWELSPEPRYQLRRTNSF